MVSLEEASAHYKRKEIQQAIVAQAHNKEVVGSFNGQGYAKRPDVLQYPQDVLMLVQQGVTSFHASEELWTNPLHIVTGMEKGAQLRLRIGWDLVLDIDCPEWKYSQIAAYYIVEALKYMRIQSLCVKFSGNHGFHIAVPFEAFPTEIKKVPIKTFFPQAPRKIALYLQDLTRPHLQKKLLEHYSISEMAEHCKKSVGEISDQTGFNPYKILGIDTILISSRHLYRMAYSFNEKSGLISVPVLQDQILDFTVEMAKPENIKIILPFLDRANVTAGEATQLLVQSYDHKPNLKEEESSQGGSRTYEDIKDAIPEQFFPPCILKLMEGIDDGKKRGLFILVNFLRSCGWEKDQVEKTLIEWNKKNKEPLREVYLKGQLRHAFDKSPVLPPSCKNEMYYKDLGIKCEESFCAKCKNPVNYARRQVLVRKEQEKPKRENLTEEQKQMRQQHREKIKKE